MHEWRALRCSKLPYLRRTFPFHSLIIHQRRKSWYRKEPLFSVRAVVRDGKMRAIEARKSAAVDNIGRALRECTFRKENQRFYLLISSEADDAQNFSITSLLSL